MLIVFVNASTTTDEFMKELNEIEQESESTEQQLINKIFKVVLTGKKLGCDTAKLVKGIFF